MKLPAFVVFAFFLCLSNLSFSASGDSHFQWESSAGLHFEKQIYQKLSLTLSGYYSFGADWELGRYNHGPEIELGIRHYFNSVSFERFHMGLTVGSFYQAIHINEPYLGVKVGALFGDRYALVLHRGWFFENRITLEPFIKAEILLPIANNSDSSSHADYLISIGANICLLFALY